MDLTRLQCELQWFTHGWSRVVIEKSKKKLQSQIGIISIWIIFLTDPPNWRNECLKSLSDSFGFCFYLSWFFFTTTWICSCVNKRCLQLGSQLYTVNTPPFLYNMSTEWVSILTAKIPFECNWEFLFLSPATISGASKIIKFEIILFSQTF